MTRKLTAEFIGTFILVFFGVGSAVLAGADSIGAPGIALAFGFTLLLLVYTIGPISGCHVNPAVTLGVLLNKGITPQEAGGYVAAQFGGGIVAGLLLKLLTAADIGGIPDKTGNLGINTWADNVTAFGAITTEVLLTMLLVFVVLQITGDEAGSANPGFAGLGIGFTLAVVHFVGIPVTGTSVNPARSLGPTVFSPDGWAPLWLFILAPLAGAVLGWAVHRVLTTMTTPAPADRTREAA